MAMIYAVRGIYDDHVDGENRRSVDFISLIVTWGGSLFERLPTFR